MVADEMGNDVKRIINDSFGNLLLDSGASLDICLGFAVGLTDKDTGLIHLGYREYDPAIGRFITPDPLGFAGGDVDVYGYCLDDPINFHDRTGLAGKSEKSKDGALARIYKGVKKAVSEGSKASAEAVSKAGEALIDAKRNSLKNWGGKGRTFQDGPKYGNWGGGRYSGGVEGGKIGSKPPVDSSDEAYKKHDLAYERISNMDLLENVNEIQKQKIKEADEVLVDDLKKLDNDPSNWPNSPKEKDRGYAKMYRNNAKLFFKYKNYVN